MSQEKVEIVRPVRRRPPHGPGRAHSHGQGQLLRPGLPPWDFELGHVHQAPVGVAGPIVVPLFVPPAPPTNLRHIKQSGVATPSAGTTGADLCQDPGAYYVNYHTTVFPLGAIRGQLH